MTGNGKIEAVILDMDGVITQTAKLHARVWKQMFDAYLAERGQRDGRSYAPFEIQTDYIQYVDGKPRYDGVQSFLAARGIELPAGTPADPPTRETVCGLGNRKNDLFLDLITELGVEVFDDTLQQMKRWRDQGLKLAVITSSRNGERILWAAGVLDRFDVKIDGNDLARLGVQGKPAPDIFLRAAAQLGVSPNRAAVVEDAISGVQAGRAGHFALVVGVARQDNAEQLRQHGADVVVGDLRQLDLQWAATTATASAARPTAQAALEHFEEIAARLGGRRFALFLDYDGTLTPIVDRPQDATLSPTMRQLLADLADEVTVAIVSGRDLDDVRRMVGLENLIYAGSHGFDIAGPNGLRMQHEDAQAALPDLEAAEGDLHQRLAAIDGVLIERKRFAIAIHYRLVAQADQSRVEQAVEEVQQQHGSLRKKGGKKIYELQPDVPWDKGRAVLWLRQTLGLDQPGPDQAGVVTAYLGDDETDEDAFAALAGHSWGLGIRVGQSEGAGDDPSSKASFFLDDCEDVQRLLEALKQLNQRGGSDEPV